MNPVSDEAVMLEVREGQVGRLAILFERHHRSIFHFCYRMTGNSELSEDLTQEVFMRMLKYRRSFRPRATFTAWMYRIARNVVVDSARKRRPEAAWDDETNEPMSAAVSADESIHREQEIRLVRKALNGLPADKREVLVLSRFHELRYEEIGKILGCEVGAVKVRVYRAMRALGRAFTEMTGEPPRRVSAADEG